MLIANNITVQRGIRSILHNLTLHIAPGQIVALLGRNGAGKSTLLKAMSGEFNVASEVQLHGDMTLNGAFLHTFSAKSLAQARAVLPQSVQFSFPFTALEVVLLGRYPHGGGDSWADRTIALETLALAGATSLAERNVTTLSGGELARVQFARVLAQLYPTHEGSASTLSPPSPRYLLLDEPTAALDLAHQHHLLGTLRKLAGEWHIGVLAIMHDPNLAARYADQLAWLSDGTLLAQDTPEASMTPALIKACMGIEVEVMRPFGKSPYAMV